MVSEQGCIRLVYRDMHVHGRKSTEQSPQVMVFKNGDREQIGNGYFCFIVCWQNRTFTYEQTQIISCAYIFPCVMLRGSERGKAGPQLEIWGLTWNSPKCGSLEIQAQISHQPPCGFSFPYHQQTSSIARYDRPILYILDSRCWASRSDINALHQSQVLRHSAVCSAGNFKPSSILASLIKGES